MPKNAVAEMRQAKKSLTGVRKILHPNNAYLYGEIPLKGLQVSTEIYLLLLALNFPVIDSVPQNEDADWERLRWGGQEEFCNWLGELVQEFKEQISFLIRMRADSSVSSPLPRDFMERYERHRSLFEKMRMEWSLSITYSFTTELSLDGDRVTLNQNLALLGFVKLVELGELDYLRKCGVCQRWYLATRPDKVVCSKACRQKKHCSDPEHKRRRRENYQLHKIQKAKEAAGERKTNHA